MYQYDEIDQCIVDERVSQFRDQTRRHLAGELSEDDFRPLRLQNGLYIQRYAPMLRVAIPYGLVSSTQLRAQHHHGPFRRRGQGRNRRLIRVVRVDPPMVNLSSGIRLPAAQIQDRGQRQRGRSRCHTGGCQFDRR